MIAIGIIGLGVQGRRMLARLPEHDRLHAVAAWDPDPATAQAAIAQHPELQLASGAQALLERNDLACVYIASPPASHLEHANRAFDAGFPVFCEKPLAVDFEEARRTLARIEKERLRGAVNFSLASSAGLASVKAALDEGEVGTLQRIEIEVAFKQWPRPWQADAGPWLSQRREGGFTREVLSHFVFVLQRVLEKARVEETKVEYPPDGVGSESRLTARLRAGGIPVAIEGRVGGDEPDFNRFRLVGERGTLEFRDWMASRRRAGSSEPMAPRASGRPSYLRQFDQLAAFVDGKPHALPDFAEALAVQETIEALLAGRTAR